MGAAADLVFRWTQISTNRQATSRTSPAFKEHRALCRLPRVTSSSGCIESSTGRRNPPGNFCGLCPVTESRSSFSESVSLSRTDSASCVQLQPHFRNFRRVHQHAECSARDAVLAALRVLSGIRGVSLGMRPATFFRRMSGGHTQFVSKRNITNRLLPFLHTD